MWLREQRVGSRLLRTWWGLAVTAWGHAWLPHETRPEERLLRKEPPRTCLQRGCVQLRQRPAVSMYAFKPNQLWHAWQVRKSVVHEVHLGSWQVRHWPLSSSPKEAGASGSSRALHRTQAPAASHSAQYRTALQGRQVGPTSGLRLQRAQVPSVPHTSHSGEKQLMQPAPLAH